MSTLIYDLNSDGVESDEEHVRATVTVVDDAPSAVEASRPDVNDAGHDPDTGGGLTRRDLASAVIPSARYAPTIGNANDDLTARVDNQISTSGTAAERERAGEWGHGTLHVQDATEPVFKDGTQFSEDYFDVGERVVQDGTGMYMTSARQPDDATAFAVQERARVESRKAQEASALARYFEESMR